MSLSVVILAAGNGKRMHTSFPKVLHRLGGLSLLERVVKTVSRLSAEIYIVYGFGGEQMLAELEHLSVRWIQQTDRLGTGHAVLQALPNIPEQDQVLVLVADSPLVSLGTLQNLVTMTEPHGVGFVTTHLANPTGFGRILRDQTGRVLGIVEHRDASPEQQEIKEINSGIIIAPAKKLKQWLPSLSNHNAQGEYYLTDIIALAVAEGLNVDTAPALSSEEVLGINDRLQLAQLERHYQRQIAESLLLAGVTLMDPSRFDVRGEVNIAEDVIIDVNVILEGKVTIGRNSIIGPNCLLKDTIIGENVKILANSVIEAATVESNSSVGPFAHLRPGTHLRQHVKVGNFVEIKNTEIGEYSKASHLSYLGDAHIGKDVNIGCGTITCNYDGINKHRTIIDDGAFIGSDTQLVAPVTVGKNATIGAGSTITHDTPPGQLTLSRVPQVTISDWQRKKPSEDASN
jgi:bifunctional UDP-N-acetylglucosamine pyrophosphorylase/glucosamine-1-phosphate N-acetyltransferase